MVKNVQSSELLSEWKSLWENKKSKIGVWGRTQDGVCTNILNLGSVLSNVEEVTGGRWIESGNKNKSLQEK